MTNFSKPIQTTEGIAATVISTHGDWLWIALVGKAPQSWHLDGAKPVFVNVPEPKTIFLREYANHDGIEYSDYRITLVPGQPPQIEEVKP